MDWLKLDARIITNAKIRRLSAAEFRAYLFVLAWSALHDTEGRLPSGCVEVIPHVGPGLIARLEAAGFLEPNGDGWTVHDWTDWQEPFSAAERRRRLTANRVRRLRAKRKEEEEP